MKFRIKNLFITLLSFVLLTHDITGQPGRQGFNSPEVRKDRTVTFRYLAPNAKEVKLSTQLITGQQIMTKDDTGIMEHNAWTG